MVSIRLILLLAAHVYLAHAGTAGAGDACTETADCVENKGLQCNFLLTPCDKGTCGCKTGQTYSGTTCEDTPTVLFLGDSCTNTDTTPVPKASCSSNTITCNTGTKTSNSFCKDANDKVLGEECTSGTHTCYTYGDRVPASPASVQCTDVSGTDKCACIQGYIEDQTTLCRRKTIGDACSNNNDCPQTNQECSSSTCQCKTDTQNVNGACLVSGEVAEGEACTYSSFSALTSKSTTCKAGLYCGTCPDETTKKCLNSGSFLTPTLFHLMAAICLAFFGRKML